METSVQKPNAKANLVAVNPADPLVEGSEELLLEVTLLLSPRVVQVVGVNDAHHMVKLVCPALPMMVPVEMLRLLQHGYICLPIASCHVSSRHIS